MQVTINDEPIDFLGWTAEAENCGVTAILSGKDTNFDSKPLKVTRDQLDKVNSGELFIFVDGECRYADQLGGELLYSFGFTFELDPYRALERYQIYRRKKADSQNPN
jgi:hypothetical protein